MKNPRQTPEISDKVGLPRLTGPLILAMTLAGCETRKETEQILNQSVRSTHQESHEAPFDTFTKGEVQPGMNEVMKQAEGKRWTGRLKSNGGREAALYVPHPLDSKEATELILFFHGGGANEMTPEGTGKNKLEMTLDATYQMKNAVLIYPLSAGARGVKGIRYDEHWMRESKGENMADMIREAQNILENEMNLKPNSLTITLKAHSAGGEVIKNGSLSLLKAKIPVQRVDFLDASYSNWARQAYQRLAPFNPDIRFNILMAVNEDSEEAIEKGKGVNSAETRELDGKKGVKRRKFESWHSEILCTHFNWPKVHACKDLFEGSDKGETFFRRAQDSMFER